MLSALKPVDVNASVINTKQTKLEAFINTPYKGCGMSLISSEMIGDVVKKSYKFCSQVWPLKKYEEIPQTEWSHTIDYYIPQDISHKKSLLFVTGGYNFDNKGAVISKISLEILNFANIANQQKIVVINLHDIPNQHLFMNGNYKREDQIISYTYKLFLEKNGGDDLPGHLPMAKSIVSAMDHSQVVLAEQDIEIENFILAGFSKRGLAVWLAGIADQRVTAIIPVVIDILNTKKTIQHICESYSDGCPPALKDYLKEGIIDAINSEGMEQLMLIEDPYQYIAHGSKAIKKQFAKLDKFIINSSGDDFFVPSSSSWYFKDLPGLSNHIRYLPNAMHYLKGNFIADTLDNLPKVEEAINSYTYLHCNNKKIPKVASAVVNGKIVIQTDPAPSEVTLWTSHNQQSKDFRVLSSYSKVNFAKHYLKSFFTDKLCDNCYEPKKILFTCENKLACTIEVELPKVQIGWQAAFAEIQFDIDGYNFIVTSEVAVSGQNVAVSGQNIPHSDL
jgi:PhoPQ-activated pathogenicity-related protein